MDNDKRLNKEDLTIWCSLSFKVNAPGAPPEALTILEQPAAQAKVNIYPFHYSTNSLPSGRRDAQQI